MKASQPKKHNFPTKDKTGGASPSKSPQKSPRKKPSEKKAKGGKQAKLEDAQDTYDLGPFDFDDVDMQKSITDDNPDKNKSKSVRGSIVKKSQA